jgi:hypothetical protein
LIVNAQYCIFYIVMNIIKLYQLIQKTAPQMGGVFSINDLRNLFNQTNNVLLHREIRNLEKEQILRRFRQGFYITTQYNPELLACRVYPEAYISCATVLAKHLVIGSISSRTVYAVKTGRNKQFETPEMRLVYFGIKPKLMFDISVEQGIRYASAEKAFIDTLYFYQKGARFSFDIFSDMNLTLINGEMVEKFLTYYENQRFISFVKGMIRSHE